MVLAQRVFERDIEAVDDIPMAARLCVLRFDRALRIIRREDDAELFVRAEQCAERYVALDRVRFPQMIVPDGPGCGDESSEARRVGKEWVRTCRTRWSQYHKK